MQGFARRKRKAFQTGWEIGQVQCSKRDSRIDFIKVLPVLNGDFGAARPEGFDRVP